MCYFRFLSVFWSILYIALPTTQAQTRVDSLERNLPTLAYIVRADALNELATHYLERDITKALQFAQQARQISEERSYSKGEAQARINIGNLFAQTGNYEGAIQAFVKALHLTDKYQLWSQKMLLLNSIGTIYRNQKNYTKAIEKFSEALHIAEKLNVKKDIADCENYLGGCYYFLKEYEAALKYFERSLETREELGDSIGVARLKNNSGLILKRQGRYAEALRNFEYTRKMQEKIKSKGGLSIVLDNIGDTYLAQKDFVKALEYHTQSLALAKEVKNKNAMLDAYESLSETYKATRNFEKALECQSQFMALQDSLNNQELQKAFSDQQLAYTIEKQERELELSKQQAKVQNLELERSNNLAYAALIVLFLGLFLGFSLYRRYQQKREANRLLEEKNIEIENRAEQIKAQAEEIGLQNAIILDNHTKLTDSILYAKRIQDSLLIDEKRVTADWEDLFIFYKPKDIVSGDFYWFDTHQDKDGNLEKLICIVADCTGHGVPGAFMTVLGHSLLNQIIRERNVTKPSMVLSILDKGIGKLLHQKQDGSTDSTPDGMDLIMAIWDLPTRTLTFSSAKRPLYQFRQGEVIVHAGSRFPIAGNEYRTRKTFEETKIAGEVGDVFYFFTDGYVDQFGDNPNVKYTTKRFRALVQELGYKDTTEQKMLFKHHFEEWRGSQSQTDDVLLLGLKV